MSNYPLTKGKTLLFSQTLVSKNKAHKIAYIAILSAFVIISNICEFKLPGTQFSLTLAVSALVGMIIGPIFGFLACFLGDLIGFLYNSAGFAYMPWIGIATGLTASIFGLIVNGVECKNKKFWVYKVIVAGLVSFLLCTVLINTTALWITFNQMKTPFHVYLYTRLFISGQIWNSLLNYGILFLIIPALNRIKALRIQIK